MRGVKTAPTEEQRRTVRGMSGFGIPHEQIATYLGIDAKTLRKCYRGELDRGMVEANIKVAQTLFTLATVDKSVPAAIFWLKARAGWREKHVLDAPGEESQSGQVAEVVYRWATPEDQVAGQHPAATPRRAMQVRR